MLVVPTVVLLYLASRFLAATALTAVRATIAWHVYDVTGSKVLLGLIGLVQFVPAVVMSLLGGVVADRTNRTRVVQLCQVAATFVSPILLAMTLLGRVEVWLLLATAGLLAATAAFEQPSRASLLVSFVPREEFPRVVTRAATVQSLAFATGPALAGVLIAWNGPVMSYALHTVLCALSALAFTRLPAVMGTPSRLSVLASLREGFDYVRSNRIVLACMSLDMFAVILGGASALLPVFAEEVLQVGPRGYGMLSAAMEIGALSMALFLAARRPISHAGRALLVSVVLYGIATIVFGLSRWLPLSLVAYGLVGAFDQVSVVLRHTVVQMSTPDEVRGRVSSINMLFIQASNQLGALESGLLAAAIGAPAAVVFGGVGAIVVAVAFAIGFVELRRYRIGRPDHV